MNISSNHLDTLTWTSVQRARLEKHQHIENIYQWNFLGKGSRERRGSRAIFLVASVFKNEVEKRRKIPKIPLKYAGRRIGGNSGMRSKTEAKRRKPPPHPASKAVNYVEYFL